MQELKEATKRPMSFVATVKAVLWSFFWRAQKQRV